MKIIIVIAFSICLFKANAQNLVPNPSFETYSICPDNYFQIDRAVGWSTFAWGTPDYFNACSIICNPGCFGVPNNSLGAQYAIGNGYAGLVFSAGYNEVIGVKLIDSLVIATKYFVTAYVSRAMGFSTGASNNIGFKFSTVQYDTINQMPKNNYAQVNEPNLILDTLNWVKIGGSFIADSSYNYIAIGNFFDFQNTTYYPPFVFDAYYYIDYVCVSQDSMECAQNFVGVSAIKQERFSLYPNPVSDVLSVSNIRPGMKIEIFNLLGETIIMKVAEGENEFINLQELTAGVYLISVNEVRKKFIKN
jgi:hypothetical protein